MKLAAASFALIAVVALIACGSHHNTLTAPTNHRVTLPTTACRPQPPQAPCTNLIPGTAECASDGDCTAGLDGVCKQQVGGLCGCVYDECLTDGDCAAGTDCSCDANRGGAGNSGRPTACVPANCRIDADCGPGRFCSPSDRGGCGGTVGYYCHTPDDECGNASDCGSTPMNCSYSLELQHWVCSKAVSCSG